MEIIYNLQTIKRSLEPSVVALGTFDGIHLGHQDVIKTAKNYADQYGLKLYVYTFSNNPLETVDKNRAPKKIISNIDKEKIFKELGVDILFNVVFNENLVKITAKEFLTRLNILNYECIVVGANYSYGFKSEGNTETLRISSEKNGFKLIVRNLISISDEIISSSNIRAAIANGAIEKANLLLGREYYIKGVVVHGDARGRTIGFKTANINLKNLDILLPQVGVYAVKVIFNNTSYYGMANVGVNPTFNSAEKRLEVNIFNFNKDLYDNEIKVCFFKRIRSVEKFTGIEELKNQLCKDKKQIKNYFNL